LLTSQGWREGGREEGEGGREGGKEERRVAMAFRSSCVCENEGGREGGRERD